jgi:hypothetical protein
MLAHSCSSLDFHLFLIMQASAQDEFVEVESDTHSSSSGGGGGSNGSSRDSKGGKDQSSKSNRKWWGLLGAAAKAALGGCANNKSSSTGRAAARAVNEQQIDTAQQQRQERSHQLVAAALEVLLRLTPLPPGCDSCFKSLARPDVSPVRSLAMPLLAHCDTVKALAGCIWSSWSDVQTKAVSQQLEGGAVTYSAVLSFTHGIQVCKHFCGLKTQTVPAWLPASWLSTAPTCLPTCLSPFWSALGQSTAAKPYISRSATHSHRIASCCSLVMMVSDCAPVQRECTGVLNVSSD